MATSMLEDAVTDVNQENPNKKRKKQIEPGIIYLSRIPPYMNVKHIRDIFARFGEVGRVFLQPDDKAPSGKKGRLFTEGWVELEDKRVAKAIALALNNTQIGGKKRSRWYDELWNIKYLHRFKWVHLNERLAYEKAVHQQRMRTEISQAKREAAFYIENAEKRKRLIKKEKKLKKSGENLPNVRPYEFQMKETEDEILARKKDSKLKKAGKRTNEDSVLNDVLSKPKKLFLTSIFSRTTDTQGKND
ncbi:hypothetical protein CHS0354_032220 [Potamilus streckersoni]|uniref:Activator of basal transcription 1 n=1 Tax=Potamilus streckersoni TaxID=2493646 RepID=A0AAE0RMH0_9BIVA|nr:hypothetical protein CHS0354_032220 [Potamilus streckersoni]